MSTRKNVNLNKELPNDWNGRVRHWEKQWATPKDKTGAPVPKSLKLLKWAQTGQQTQLAAAKHPHIRPVIDLSLVPGARLGLPPDADADGIGQVPNPLAVPQLLEDSQAHAAAAPAPAAVGAGPEEAGGGTVQPQDQQHYWQPAEQQQQAASLPPYSLPAAAGSAAAATPIGTLGATTASLTIDSTGNLAARGAATNVTQPSPSAVTDAFIYSQPSLPFTVSDYTTGTGTATDSGAAGRLQQHTVGITVSEYTDSMDVDRDTMGGTVSQGTTSMQPISSGRGGRVEADDADYEDQHLLDDTDDDDLGNEEVDDEDEGISHQQNQMSNQQDDADEVDEDDDMPG